MIENKGPEYSRNNNGDEQRERGHPRQASRPLESIAALYAELLQIQDEIATHTLPKPSALTPEEVGNRLSAGMPLLSFDDFFPGWPEAQLAFQRLLGWATSRGVLHPRDKLLWASKDVGEAQFRELARDWFDGRLPSLSGGCQDKVGLMAVFGASLKPFLQAHCRMLKPLVDQNLWRQRLCPICGGTPDIGYLDRDQGARWLVCSRCDSEWLFQRLECPYCGCQDQGSLSYLTDEEGIHRLYLCDKCQSYLKVIDLRHTNQNVPLPLERLLTMDMDTQAWGKGYRCGVAETKYDRDEQFYSPANATAFR